MREKKTLCTQNQVTKSRKYTLAENEIKMSNAPKDPIQNE